jgi:protein TonB
MTSHADILDERESLTGAVLRSAGLHAALAAIVFGWTAMKLGSSNVERWGDPASLGGGAVAITPVASIPLPSREGRVNRVANDTESQIPAAPKEQKPAAVKPPEPDAVAIKGRSPQRAKARTPASQQKYSPIAEPKPNQVYSSTGQALSSSTYSLAPGGGGVGSGSGSPFGNRFGWYEALLRAQVARNWRSQELDSNIRSRVAITFEIARNGQVGNVRVSQSSGNFAMDQSAQRAILMSNPLPQLPREYERDSATIEFWFSLQQ